MGYSVSPGSAAGRFGEGFGRGLGEQLPAEVERYRLSQGLKKLANMQETDPLQQMAHISALPGITPQMIQTFGELLRNRARGQAFQKGVSQNKALQEVSKIPAKMSREESSEQGLPYEQGEEKPSSITTREPLEAALKPPKPKTYAQLVNRAGEMFNENPALFSHDPSQALQAAQAEEQLRQSQYQTSLAQRSGERDVQQNIKNLLSERGESVLGAAVPGRVKAKLIDKATQAVLPKNQGGEGLTEEEAAKKYGKELDEISRDYDAIRGLDGITMFMTENPKGAIRSLQKKFAKRDELEDFADSMISNNGVSPPKAYYEAYPFSDKSKKLVDSLKKVDPYFSLDPRREKELSVVAEKALKVMKNDKNQNPLAFYWALQKKGYMPSVFMDYLRENVSELHPEQQRAFDKNIPIKPHLNDFWIGD